MTDAEAIEYAAQWGSYMRGGDPGACMYGFSGDTLVVQSEYHRKNCLAWINRHCKVDVQDDPDNDAYEEDELDKLTELASMIEKAPVEE